VKTVDADSFFNIFQDRSAAAKNTEGVDSEDENNIRDKIDEVQQMVEDFHDILIPDALEYYLGLNQDFDMLGMEDDDDSDDEDEEEGEGPPASGKKDKKKKDKKDGDDKDGEGGGEGGDGKE